MQPSSCFLNESGALDLATPSTPSCAQGICFVGRDSPHLVTALHRWNAAFTPALAAYLRQKQHYLDDHLAAVLPEHELEWLRNRGSPPIAVLQVGMGHGLAARPALHRHVSGAWRGMPRWAHGMLRWAHGMPRWASKVSRSLHCPSHLPPGAVQPAGPGHRAQRH